MVDRSLELDAAMKTVRDTVARDTRARQAPLPSVSVVELGDGTVTLAINVWCAAGDYAELKVTVVKDLQQALGDKLKTLSG